MEYISIFPLKLARATLCDPDEDAAADLQCSEIPREAAIARERVLRLNMASIGGDVELLNWKRHLAACSGSCEYRTAGGRGGLKRGC